MRLELIEDPNQPPVLRPPRVTPGATHPACEEEWERHGEQAAAVANRESNVGAECESPADHERHPRQTDEGATDHRRDEQGGSGWPEGVQPRLHGRWRDGAGLPENDRTSDEYNDETAEDDASGVAGHGEHYGRDTDEVSPIVSSVSGESYAMFRRVRVIAIVVAVLIGSSAPAFADFDQAQIEKARSGTLTPTFQEDLPGHEVRQLNSLELGDPNSRGKGSGSGAMGPGNGSQVDPRLRQRPRRDGARRVDTREYHERERESGGPVSGVLTMFMWGLLAVGAGLLIFWFVSEMAKGDSEAALPIGDDNDAAVKAATAAIIDKPLGDADELAARGEFAEAIHTLLLRTLHELARSAMVRVERSHTSREILARVPLAPDAREALSMLITYVELTHFGDDPAGAADYAKCREQFNRFASAFRAGLAITSRQPQALGGTSLAS